MNCTDNNEESRLHVVMATLIYPAILGAIIYDVFKLFILDVGKHPAPQLIVLIFALILLYVVDYTYTVVERPKKYSTCQFIGDLFIVISLFFAIKLVLAQIPIMDTNESFRSSFPQAPLVLSFPIFWLFITKILSVYWEVVEPPRDFNFWPFCGFSKATLSLYFCGSASDTDNDKHALKFFEVTSDLAFVIVYGLILWYGYKHEFIDTWLDGNHTTFVELLASFVLLDVATYLWHAWIENKTAP